MADVGFMLVHGGVHDSRCWSRMTPYLDRPVLAVDLPGRGSRPADLSKLSIADFVESAVADLDGFDEVERVVLVGHSMAGLTIPAVAARRPNRVAHLVFLSCLVPPEGTSATDDMPLPIRAVDRIVSRFRTSTAMSTRMAKRMFCNDMDRDQTAFALSVLTPEAMQVMREKVSRNSLPPASVVPRTYIKLLRDRAIKTNNQDRMIANLGACDVVTLDSGHNAMISHPRQLGLSLNQIRVHSRD